MTLKTQKQITAGLVAATTLGGFEVLAYILNLNQIGIFLNLAFWFWIYLWFYISILYDLHFKNPGALARAKARHESVPRWLKRTTKIWLSALADRFSHLKTFEFFKAWMNYLLLPGFIFWATIGILYVNFGFFKIQQIVILLSSAALIVNFWYLKEIFIRRKEVVDKDVFVSLSVVKIYASAAVYAACLAIAKGNCLDPVLLALGVLGFTFLLIYQALFQHRLINLKNLVITLAISAAMSVLSYLVLVFWGYNYFTGGIFLTAFYNLFWGIFHYRLDKTFTWRAFWEILAISLIVAAMVLSVTNFSARILDSCQYRLF